MQIEKNSLKKIFGIGLIVVLALILTIKWVSQADVMASKSLRLQLQKGQEWTWQIQYRSAGEGHFPLQLSTAAPASPSPLAIPDQKAEASLEGKLFLKVESVSHENYRIRFDLEAGNFQSHGLGAAEPFREKMASGHFVLTRRGHIESFILEAETYQHTASLLADIFSLMDLDLPPGQEKSWTGQEHGFQQSVPVTWFLVTRSATAFDLTKQYPKEVFGMTRYEGELQARLDTRTYVTNLKAQRKRETQGSGGMRSQDETILVLKELPREAHIFAPKVLSVQDTLTGETYKKLAQENAYRQILGDLDLARVQTLMGQLHPTDAAKNSDIYQILKAFIALHPEELDSFMSYFLELPYTDARLAYTAMALTAVGSEAAQKLLMKAIEGLAHEPEKLENIIPHLSFVAEPTQQSENFLRELTASAAEDRVQKSARLGLGTMAHHLRDKAPERSEAILKLAAETLQAANDPNEIAHGLRVVGNIGLPEQLPVLRPFLSHQKNEVRQEAYRSLRHVDSEEGRSLLLQAARGDAGADLVETSLAALRFAKADPQILVQYRQLLFPARSAKQARLILGNTAVLYPALPEAKTLLEDFLKSCGLTELCTFTESAIASLR